MNPKGAVLAMSAPGASQGPGGRKARERALRRTEVLAAARRLFARKGYQRTTMVEIAGAAELALGTLYQLFPSKEAILAGLLERYVDLLIARVRDAIGDIDDPRLRLHRVVRTQLAFSRDNADVLRFYLTGWTGYEFAVRQRFGERIDTKYEQYLALLAGVFRRGVREGAFAAQPPRRLAVALAGMIHALIRRWLREKRLNLMAEGEALVAVVLDGVTRAPRNGTTRR
jgi:TetR/AcrR family fatty acid metabolism transcriptional regulator